jgi:ferredoxin
MEAVKTSCCCSSNEFETNCINTLEYNPAKCINCGMCLLVCPHAVFTSGDKAVKLAYPEKCMECGACALNCPPRAIRVDSGVGCASAMIRAALTGKEISCGPDSACCT